MATRMTVLALSGCMASGVFGTLDVLATANYCAARRRPDGDAAEPVFEWQVATPNGDRVRGYSGAPIDADCALEAVTHCDVVILPSAFAAMRARARCGPTLASQDRVRAWLRAQHEAGTLIATACTGSFVLAEAGLLRGRTTTTHWGAEAEFRARYPDVSIDTSRMVLDLGDLVCAGGASSYMDLALHLVERFAGRAVARDCAQVLVVDPQRNSQSPYQTYLGETDHGDDVVIRAQQVIESRFFEPWTLQRLAALHALSPRTFSRRFKAATGDSPIHYLQRVRIEAVKEKLATERTPVDAIVRACGYEDENSFRRLFRRYTGTTMQTYRDRFASYRS